MLKRLNHLGNAEPGIYIVYSPGARQGHALFYVGPFDTWQSAENHDDGPYQREWITEKE